MSEAALLDWLVSRLLRETYWCATCRAWRGNARTTAGYYGQQWVYRLCAWCGRIVRG